MVRRHTGTCSQVGSRYDPQKHRRNFDSLQLTRSSLIAQHLACTQTDILIDCFSGVGGNTIAFARSGKWGTIIAIEENEAAMDCAKHNARLYGVADRITWVLGDCFEVLARETQWHGSHALIFASPPWGGNSNDFQSSKRPSDLPILELGPGYRTDSIFNLLTMQPYNLFHLLSTLRTCTLRIVLYLPRTSDIRQLAHCADTSERIPIIHYCMEGASKVSRYKWMQNISNEQAVCAYFGASYKN